MGQFEIDNLKLLLQRKKELVQLDSSSSEMDRKKIQELEKLFNNDICFFNIQYDSAMNILRFLGVNEDDLLSTYKRLTDPSLIRGNIKFR